MSKAFTRESDDAPDALDFPPLPPPLPPGAKNYLTPGGARRLREELDRLLDTERVRLTAAPDETEARRPLQGLTRRLRHLQHSLQTAVVPPPPTAPDERDRVRFGATVTVRGRGGEESRYRIVGVDETDIDRGWVSWFSPIARALLNARTGRERRRRFP